MDAITQPVGDMLRDWRQRRRRSQLDLALEAGISTRHLSFLETGRARPSREMVLRLAAELRLPQREANRMLLAAGFAPVFPQRRLDDPALAEALAAVRRVLTAHEPFPALAVDRQWTLIEANAAVAPLLGVVAPALLAPPVNVMRLSLHPDGLAPRIVNLGDWRAHVFARLRGQIDASGDSGLVALLEELAAYPGPAAPPRHDPGIATVLHLRMPQGEMRFLTTITVFGTPIDVTLEDLAIESLFPADAATAALLRRSSAPG